jgi:hypothetical protein
MANQYTKKNFNLNDINNIVSLYKNGYSFTKIGEIYNVQKNRVKRILIDNNVWVDGKNLLKKKFNEDEIKNIINLYLNDKISAESIGKIYSCSKIPIINLLKKHNLLRKNNGNGKKIILTPEIENKIKKLYLNDFKSINEISIEVDLTISFINKYLNKSNFRRNKSQGVSVGLVKRYKNIPYNEYLATIDDYYKYELEVLKITRKQPINLLENYNKRGNSGIDGAYHLDHKFSKLEGYKNKIEPEIIGNIINLEFIPWKENLTKRTKCSIELKKLITKFNNNNNG